MTKKIEKIYGIHSAMEILKTSPDRILNIWLQDSAKSKPIILIHDAAKNIGLSIQLSKRDRLDKMTSNKNHQDLHKPIDSQALLINPITLLMYMGHQQIL